jgi:hypothetical protein
MHIALLSDSFRNLFFGILGKSVTGDFIPRANATCKPDLHRAADLRKQDTLTGLNLQTHLFRICRRLSQRNPVLRITKASERRSKNAAYSR